MSTARTLCAALAACMILAAPARAEKPPAKKDQPFGALGGNGKEPIKIDADRLDVFDRENRAVFIGNVVAVQGASTVRCSTMTVYYKRGKDGTGGLPGQDGPGKGGVKDASGGAAPAAAARGDAKSDGKSDGKSDAAPATRTADAAGDDATAREAAKEPAKNPAENGIKQVICAGPVTVVQKDQVATGDHAVFDQDAKRVVLTGNVVLSQCQNVTRGQRLVYDMNTGRANMDPVAGGRVSALLVPGEKGDGKDGKDAKPKGCAQPPAGAAPKPRAQLN